MNAQLVRYKASDISDDFFLDAIEQAQWARGFKTLALRWDVAYVLRYEYPYLPDKVVLAKFKQLLKRGLVDGCECSCRGDWEVVG